MISVEILETINRYLTFSWYSVSGNSTICNWKIECYKNVKRSRILLGIWIWNIRDMIWYQQNDLFQFYNQFYFGVCVIKYLRSHRSILEMVSRNLRPSDDFRVWQKVSPRKQSPWPTRLNNITRIACHARHNVESYAVIIVLAQR